MIKKQCFKCLKEKEITEFYKHPQMFGGYVNKCKECNKIDVRNNYKKNFSYYQKFDKIRKAKGYVKPIKSKPVYSKKISLEDYKTYKGTLTGYRNLHHWVTKQLGTPNKCEHCNRFGLTGKRIHWANKTGLYKKDINDWLRLCASCHLKYDKSKKT